MAQQAVAQNGIGSAPLKKPFKVKYRKSDIRNVWIARLIIWVAIILSLFPTVWVIMSSFSKGDSFFMSSLFPKSFSLVNYTSLFKQTDFMIWIVNSLKLSLFVSVLQIIITTLAAYAFARMRFHGRKYGLMTLLILQVFPSSMSLAAYYLVIYKFGLLDNNLILIVILAAGSAYNIWLFKSYIDSLPKALDEAAYVDGANSWQVFIKILMPLAMPMVVVIFLFSFIGAYSEYLISSIVLQSPGNYTLPLGLRTFIYTKFAAHWTLFAAGSVLSSLPILILFMALQKFIQGGLAAGAVKG